MNDVERLLNGMDIDAKNAFTGMERENQLLVLFSIEMSNSNRLAKVEKKQIAFEEDNKMYREKREHRESENDIMNTTQKIVAALAEAEAKRFNYWTWFRDRVLPSVITLITLAILYLTFGGKLP